MHCHKLPSPGIRLPYGGDLWLISGTPSAVAPNVKLLKMKCPGVKVVHFAWSATTSFKEAMRNFFIKLQLPIPRNTSISKKNLLAHLPTSLQMSSKDNLLLPLTRKCLSSLHCPPLTLFPSHFAVPQQTRWRLVKLIQFSRVPLHTRHLLEPFVTVGLGKPPRGVGSGPSYFVF